MDWEIDSKWTKKSSKWILIPVLVWKLFKLWKSWKLFNWKTCSWIQTTLNNFCLNSTFRYSEQFLVKIFLDFVKSLWQKIWFSQNNPIFIQKWQFWPIPSLLILSQGHPRMTLNIIFWIISEIFFTDSQENSP